MERLIIFLMGFILGVMVTYIVSNINNGSNGGIT